MTLYRLSGSRVKVRLSPAVIDGMGTTWRARSIRQVARPTPKLTEDLQWPVGQANVIELAEITVANVGRAATSIAEIALDLGAEHWWRWRQHYTIAGIPVPLNDSIVKLPMRLEPGDQIRMTFDVWAFLPEALAKHPRAKHVVRVRASVKANLGRVRRSPRLRGWRISKDQHNFARATPTLDQAVYGALFRSLIGFNSDTESAGDRITRVQYVWGRLRSRHLSSMSMEQIMDAMGPTIPELQRLNAGMQIWRALGPFRQPPENVT
jgi:hypothetical protein